MGRKKKKPQKPWCWYCNREFEDEKILIQHQKAKHFKCHICNKKLFTGPGLAIHCMQVHKESIDKIPGALPGRDNVNIEVYGMEGLPPESTRGYVEDEATDVPPSKIPRPAGPGIPLPGMMPPGHPMAAFNQFMPHAPAPYGMSPHGGRSLYKTNNLRRAVVRAYHTLAIAIILLVFGMPMLPRPGGPPPPPLHHHQQQMAAMMAAAGSGRMPPMSVPSSSVGAIPTPPAGIAPPPPLPSGILPPAAASAIPMPPQAAFAAYQDKDGGKYGKELPSTSLSTTPSKTLGAKTRIVCQDEQTSLEELMAQRVVPTYARGLMPFVR
ncbi:hypothetical protein GPALN_015045 [Globodera pallida]|nr:hypothetical protein GPALN_015045 [Globodera pallida]